MPAFGINNIQCIKDLADTLNLPSWLVKTLIVEYLLCRRFQGNSVTIDYGLVTVEDIKSIKMPYIILNGLTLFHNITEQVLVQRILAGAFVGLPIAALAKQESLVWAEGKVSSNCLPNPIMNSDEVEGDWKLRLNLHNRAIVLDEDGLYQWKVTKSALIPADISQRWYESDLFSGNDLEELREINQEYLHLNQEATSPDIAEKRLKKVYDNLEDLRVKMRKKVLDYHQANKDKPEAKADYTEENPPQLTLFDEFTLVKVKDGPSKKRRFKVRSYVEPIFFRAAARSAFQSRAVRKVIDAGDIYPVPIAEEIEAAAGCIILSAMCLEAYINGFVQDHLPEQSSYIERMEVRAKWFIVPALLSKADCFKPGSQPFDDFSQLVRWRNDDLAH